MDPENNNPLTNPSASAAGTTPNIDSMMNGDSMTSAADTLTSAGLAADTGTDTLNLDQISATQPEAVMAPPVEEPLVPAAPVPGSIGSVTSVPADTAPTDSMPGVEYPTNTNPAGQSFGAAQPEATTPASTTASGPLPAPEVAPQMPYNPFSQHATPTSEPAKAPVDPAFQPEVPKAAKKPSNLKSNLPMILSLGLAVIATIVAIIFFILWRQAVDNPKIVYVPAVSDDQVNSRIELLNCSHEEDYNWLIGYDHPVLGTQNVVASYTGGELRTLSIDYNATFDNETDATVARDNLAANQAATLANVAQSFTSAYNVNGSALSASIQSADSGLNVNDALTLVYGQAEGQSSTIDSLRANYEANGFTCTIE